MSFESIEVFAGAGGLVLGLEMAEFEHLGLVEIFFEAVRNKGLMV